MTDDLDSLGQLSRNVNSLRNKQVEIIDRLQALEERVTELLNRYRPLEDRVVRLEKSGSSGGTTYGR
ncbi:MAG: hypothetical protein GZ088_14815 [Acidipila sp.]|nr:hypothetical protein [Acidipila sp.]